MQNPTRLILAMAVGACDEQAEMRVTLQPAFRYPEVTLQVEDRDGTRVFDRSVLETEPDGSSGPALSTIATLGTGSFRVAEAGSLRLKLRVEDGSLSVAEEARRAAAESLWVWWSGRRKGSDAVF